MHCKDPKAISARTCYEVNIFDTRPDPSYGTGSIVNFAEVNPMPKAAGKWNTFEITAQGRQITVLLNGQKTVDLNNGLFEEGHFTLQWGAGVVKFRKVAVKPLSQARTPRRRPHHPSRAATPVGYCRTAHFPLRTLAADLG